MSASNATVAAAAASAHHSYYEFDPSTAVAVVGIVCYGLAFIATVTLYILRKSWYFWPMVFSASMDIVGYIARFISYHNTEKRPPYIVQTAMIVLAPAIMAAACYQTFGRIIYLVVPPSQRTLRTLWVPARFITPVFVTCDIISFLIQLIGVAIFTSAETVSKMNKGAHIVEIGLAIQLVGFGFFTFVGTRFIWVGRRFEGKGGADWRQLNYAVNAACALVLVRSIYRMAEFAGGQDGYVRRHEWPFWVFDALLIFFVYVLFIIFHPSKYLTNLGLRRTKEDQTLGHELRNELGTERIV